MYRTTLFLAVPFSFPTVIKALESALAALLAQLRNVWRLAQGEASAKNKIGIGVLDCAYIDL